MRGKNFTALVLKGIATAGLITIAATSPYFGLALFRDFRRQWKRGQWRKFYQSLNYLDRRGFVKIIGRDDDEIEVKIMNKGRDRIKKLDIDQMELRTQSNWDGKWRVVVFDVPVAKNNNRLALSRKLSDLGFIMVQKSVWAYPYECYEDLMILRKFYEVEKYVTYLEAVAVEDELDWRGKFNLRHQSRKK